MAQLVVRAAAAYIGFLVDGPVGAQVGWALGGFLAPPNKVEGPKLDVLTAPKLAYGAPWPRLYGVHRVSGAPLWASDLRAVESTESVGKGSGTEVTSTTYRIDLLLGLAIDSDAVGYSRIWVNKKLVYNVGPGATPDSIAASNSTGLWSDIEFLNGDPAQLPWAVYEAAIGVGNVPAYRHRVTIGFQDLDVGTSGQPPLIEVEVFTAGAAAGATYVDNFVDGLAQYTGDLIEFAADNLEFGPCIQGKATMGGGSGKSISRSITSITTPQISVLFRYSSIANGDAAPIVLKNSATQKLVVLPMRETAFDAARRPHIFLEGEDLPVLSVSLQLMNWYRAVITIVAGAGNSKVDLYDAVTGSLLQTSNYSSAHSPVVIDTIEFQVDDIAGGGSAQYSQLRLVGGAASIAAVDLADIVTAECARVGLAASEIDVTDLVGIDVTGFGTTSAARPTLEQLAGIFYFEAFCDDKIRFVKRGGASAVTIAYADTGAGVGQAGEPFNGMDRADELSIPAFYSVSLPDITRDYEPGSVMSDRLVTQSSEVRQIQGAVVMTPSQAKGRADSFARDGRIASNTGSVALDLSQIQRTPTDVITLTDVDGTTYRTRIVRTTFADTVLSCELVLDDANALRETGVAPSDGVPAVDVAAPGATYLELIDGPILRDADDDAGLYGATRITGGSGVGSRVFKSLDNVSFSTVGDITTQAIGGIANTALATTADPYVWDEVSTVTVTSSGALSSSTKSAMQADATINLLALRSGSGWEYLRFRTATLSSPGVYVLTGLLRGMRGTEEFIAGHAIGDRFVLLRTAGMIRVPGNASEIGLERFYKGVTLGQDINSAGSTALTNAAVGLKPFSPVRLHADRDGSGNITFGWTRRTRLAVRYGGSGGTLAPLGEDSEAYQVDILDSGTVVRTISATSETASYLAAEQTADFGGALPTGACDAEVFQISATVGRGAGQRERV